MRSAGFYGADAGKGMMDLLAGHWGGVKAMTDAQHAGDNAAHSKAMQDLTGNADAIAKFLSGANPNLPKTRCAACWSCTSAITRRRSARS